MNRYSKIRAAERRPSRSVDFSDLALSPPPKIPQPQMSNKMGDWLPEEKQRREEEERGKAEEDIGERFGAILSRSCSVSSTTSTSQRFGGEKNPQQSSGVQTWALKKAFSLRRSSSVSEGYCRIHDQWGALSPPPPCDDAGDMQTRSARPITTMTKKKKGRRFLKACKRLFGLSLV